MLVALFCFTTPCFTTPAAAQGASELDVPTPPPASDPPAEAAPAEAPAVGPGVATPSAPAGPSAIPPAGAAPVGLVVAPLLEAAEADMQAGRAGMALARATLVVEALPEGAPLRARAEALRARAAEAAPTGESPDVGEVVAPLVSQAELDLRAGMSQLAIPRLDFALSRLPAGSPARTRAEGLRQGAYVATPPMGGAPHGYAPQQYAQPMAPARPPRDPDQAGTGEFIELYVAAAGLGVLTGTYLTDIAGGNGTFAFTLAGLGGAITLGAGTLALHLTDSIKTGIGPSIAMSARFGLANGTLAMLAGASASPPFARDGEAMFSLVWGGAFSGAAIGMGVGFGLRPSVAQVRFAESTGLWGLGVGALAAMMSSGASNGATAEFAMTMIGLDVGILAGIIAIATDSELPMGRALMMDLGFFGGAAVGFGFTLLGYLGARTNVEVPYLGLGGGLGAVAGWLLTFFLTDGWTGEPEEPPVHVTLSPIEGGVVLGFSGYL